MKNYILFDDEDRENLLPLSFTRPVSELRVGILTIRGKWERRLPGNYSWKTQDYLQKKYPEKIAAQNTVINGHVCPTDHMIVQVKKLVPGIGLRCKGIVVAVCSDENKLKSFPDNVDDFAWIEYTGEFDFICYPWDLIQKNAYQMLVDFDLLTTDRESAQISQTNQLIDPEHIFVEPGAKLEFATINASKGPVYIGKEAEVMEGSLIRGPFALGDHGVVNMGSKIYGGTTIGPYSKVGGEISQSIILGYSNKGHDGFLGNSVLGEWCNLGAGTNVSNLKNNYEPVRVWNYPSRRFFKTGLQFCGLIMGDHSKVGINTMLNTGTVVGVACNIYGSGFPRQFIPSFSEGGAVGFKLHQLKSVFSTATTVMGRRGKSLNETDQEILTSVFDQTKTFRSF